MIGGGGRRFDRDPRGSDYRRDEAYEAEARGAYGGYQSRSQAREPLFGRGFGFGAGAGRAETREDRSFDYDSARRHRDFLDKASDEVSSWFGDENARRRRQQDHQESGPLGSSGASTFQGRGPKGYRRSDSRIREDASDRLSEDPWLDASELELSVHGGEVTLTGLVRSRSDKRRAEDLVERVAGVVHVQNNLRIDAETPPRGEEVGATAAIELQGRPGLASAGSARPGASGPRAEPPAHWRPGRRRAGAVAGRTPEAAPGEARPAPFRPLLRRSACG